MFDGQRKSQRIQAQNLEKKLKKEIEGMNAEVAKIKTTLVGESSEEMSQKLQNFKANIDDMNYKHSILRRNVSLCLTTHIQEEEKFIEAVCDSRDAHFEKYFHLHSDYCQVWFRGLGKWGCLEPIIETGGYFDLNIPRCRYRHKDLDD